MFFPGQPVFLATTVTKAVASQITRDVWQGDFNDVSFRRISKFLVAAQLGENLGDGSDSPVLFATLSLTNMQ